MVCYVAVPSRLIGVRPSSSRRDRMSASAVGGALGVIVCTPPYLLARAGLLMLGTRALVIPGIVCLAVGATLQAGATGAVKSIKMGTKLVSSGRPAAAGAAPSTNAPAQADTGARVEIAQRETPDSD